MALDGTTTPCWTLALFELPVTIDPLTGARLDPGTIARWAVCSPCCLFLGTITSAAANLLASPFTSSNVSHATYPTQLTTAGLFALHESVHDGELCVLFRNDHFSVLTKKKRILLTLVTDEDLAAKLESSGGNVAWETLEDVNGEASRFAAAEVMVPKKRQQGEHTAQRAMVPGSSRAPVRGSIVTGSSNNANVQQGVVVPSRAMGVNNSHQQVRRVDPYASPAPTRAKSKADSSGCTIM
eukprot:TRINITY_DN21801_c0_g1_i4.p1 TRINITY_DN21801_c0_g1~~TRINITY_DN21801_c0_g1_i4.p1  ORF type:complete len:240 (-),score=40.34 TRINITY_DN21801_c0_g1_i4:241-960(-)